MYPGNTKGTQVILGSMNMGYISETARNRTHNLFCPKWKLIPLGHSDSYYRELNVHISIKNVRAKQTNGFDRNVPDLWFYRIFSDFHSGSGFRVF